MACSQILVFCSRLLLAVKSNDVLGAFPAAGTRDWGNLRLGAAGPLGASSEMLVPFLGSVTSA